MGHHNEIEIKNEYYSFSKKAKTTSLVILAIGVILFAIGVFNQSHNTDVLCCIDHKTATNVEAEAYAQKHGTSHAEGHSAKTDSPDNASETHAAHGEESHASSGHDKHYHTQPWTARIWTNLMMNSYWFLIISVCALFFVGLQYIANAGWAIAIKRVPEAIATLIPYFLGVLVVVLFFGKNEIYHWAQYFTDMAAGKEGVAYDKILEGKSGFLNNGWLIIGTLVIGLIWIYFGWRLRTLSKEEDALENHNRATKTPIFIKSIKNSAAFTFMFAFSFSILSWLIVMSVDAHWFSTIFSIYNFAVGWVSALTIICMFVLFLKKMGYLKLVTDEHVHDIGKFMFAFTIFWAYIWVSQYLLIWYANISEEGFYYHTRYYPEWKPHFALNVIINFLAPFLILMTRNAKRNPNMLILAATFILIGKWNDLYLMIMPGSIGAGAGIGALEIGTTMMFAGFFIFMVHRSLTKRSLVPVNHPYIEESAHHDVGP